MKSPPDLCTKAIVIQQYHLSGMLQVPKISGKERRLPTQFIRKELSVFGVSACLYCMNRPIPEEKKMHFIML